MPEGDEDCTLPALLTPEAVRRRCNALLEIGLGEGLGGGLEHFAVNLNALEKATDLVEAVTRETYPDGQIPLHSRWRHFEFGDLDLWAQLSHALPGLDVHERARTRFDLAVGSVLLDAGAGPDWVYGDNATGLRMSRSEGLAIASFRMFAGGSLGGTPEAPKLDGASLAQLTVPELAAGFQVSPDNPLIGMENRVDILNRLGDALAARPDVFGNEGGRVGQLYDHLLERSRGGVLPAREILLALLELFGRIWPAGLQIGGLALGDIGRHSKLKRSDETDELVPFHKLSQWLAYSLVEPLWEAGIDVVDLDALTGLAEYRNGGLFLDTGVLELRSPDIAEEPLAVGSEPIVEWRALTVALLDRLADTLRQRLGQTKEELPLVKVLQGGAWTAGRRIAAEMRDGGAPPLQIQSGGAVF
ncbi:MAG: DUF1688 family protein [Rhodospirillaceae bacterium]|jgi:hypothetical protein|nr:DUF1688 family protein [Rhodospirillaceae bacterium]